MDTKEVLDARLEDTGRPVIKGDGGSAPSGYGANPGVQKEGWSEAEMLMIRTMVKPAPKLDYPLQIQKAADGSPIGMYIIPPEDVYDLVKKLWCFEDVPEKGEELIDMHSDNMVKPEECRIIRRDGRNVVVSPYYLETGGMIVDLQKPKNKNTITVDSLDINDIIKALIEDGLIKKEDVAKLVVDTSAEHIKQKENDNEGTGETAG